MLHPNQITEAEEYLRQERLYRIAERLGILGVHQGQEPTKEQINIVEGELVQWEKEVRKHD